VERVSIGYWVAALSGATVLAEHYAGLLAGLDDVVLAALAGAVAAATTSGPYGSYPPGPLSAEDQDGPHWAASDEFHVVVGERLAAALEHAHLLTYRPRDASAGALQALLDSGWTTDGVVTVSQLVAFTHFQLRVIAGLAALEEAI
jgi:CMD domain protein